MRKLIDSLLTLVMYGLFLLGAIGYVWNIAALINNDETTAMVAVRVFGILMAPVGSIMGLVELFF